MPSPRLSYTCSLRCLRTAPRALRTVTRRHGSSSHGDPHPHQPSGPVNEGFSRSFYATLVIIPLGFTLFNYSRAPTADGQRPLLERLIEKWGSFGKRWQERNGRHTAMIEQAAHDRNLFHSSEGSKRVELKFPEIFNTGSPYNVQAGRGGADLAELIWHYEEKNREEAETVVRGLEEKKAKKER